MKKCCLKGCKAQNKVNIWKGRSPRESGFQEKKTCTKQSVPKMQKYVCIKSYSLLEILYGKYWLERFCLLGNYNSLGFISGKGRDSGNGFVKKYPYKILIEYFLAHGKPGNHGESPDLLYWLSPAGKKWFFFTMNMINVT